MTGHYKIGTLAKQTGFAPAVLRAWERRYGLLAPERGAGGQRLYTDDDLRLLQWVRTLMDRGRSIGEIVRPGRAALLAHVARGRAVHEPDARSSTSVIDAWQGRIIAAALELDSRAVSTVLDEAFATLAPEHAITQIIGPVAVEVGRLWESGTCSVASEHLVTEQFLQRVRRLLDAAQPAEISAPTVAAACFPGEQHQLGLAILSWRVARHGVRVAYFGAALPLDDLARALPRSRCRVVLLSVTRRALFTTHSAAIRQCLATGPPVFIGGQGVPSRHETGANGDHITMVRNRLDDEDVVVARIVATARDPRSPVAGASQ